jgi:hypothetical protein
MKKLLVSISMLLTIGLSTTFANPNPGISEELQSAFEKEFTGAESVIWKEAGDYYKVSFIFKGVIMEAYFNDQSELEGSVRSLQYNQLPLNVITSINKKFPEADVLDVYEINNDNGTIYRLTFNSEGKKYRIKADTGGNIMEKEKLKN